MLNTNFNLLDDPWIPVLTPEGAAQEISLIELFENAHTYLGFNASPVERGVFIRLTAAITLRVREWEESWEAGRFTEAHVTYLERFRDAFRLDRFLQEEDLPAKIGTALTIVPASTLFKINPSVNADIPVAAPLTEAEAARALLQANTFALGGRQPGVPLSMKANQALGDTGFFAHGDTLFSTILLNTPEQSQEAWEADSTGWENPIQGEQMGVVRAPAGIADYLTYQARAFELFADDAGDISGVVSWVGWKHEMGSQEELLPVSPYSIFVERNGEWKRETFIRDLHTRPAPTKKQERRMTWAPTVLTGTFALYSPDLDTRCMVAERVDTLPSHWERFLGYELASITTDGKKAIIHSVTEDDLMFPREMLVGDSVEVFMEVFASVRETHARLRYTLSQVSPEAVQGERFLRFTRGVEQSARTMFNSGGEETLTAWEQKVRRSASEVLEGELGKLPVSRVLEAQGVVRGFLKYCREGAAQA